MKRLKIMEKSDGIKYDYNLYDAVKLSDDTTILITGFGKFDNRYWCEVFYFPFGSFLPGADYFNLDPSSNCYDVIVKLGTTERNIIAHELMKSLNEDEPLFYGEDIKFLKNLVLL